jgi:DNA-binding FrmR family transcriptional regulator
MEKAGQDARLFMNDIHGGNMAHKFRSYAFIGIKYGLKLIPYVGNSASDVFGDLVGLKNQSEQDAKAAEIIGQIDAVQTYVKTLPDKSAVEELLRIESLRVEEKLREIIREKGLGEQQLAKIREAQTQLNTTLAEITRQYNRRTDYRSRLILADTKIKLQRDLLFPDGLSLVQRLLLQPQFFWCEMAVIRRILLIFAPSSQSTITPHPTSSHHGRILIYLPIWSNGISSDLTASATCVLTYRTSSSALLKKSPEITKSSSTLIKARRSSSTSAREMT